MWHKRGSMSGRNGQVHISTYIPEDLGERFRALARRTEGGVAAALRKLVAAAVDEAEGLHGANPALESVVPKGVGQGRQIGFRLRADERRALREAAEAHGTSPANWIRSLAIVHLAGKPQWNPAELEELRAIFREVRAIGNNVNQIARSLNVAVKTGEYAAHQGDAAKDAVELVRHEMRRIVAVMTGNFDYWGLPQDVRPAARSGASDLVDAEARAADAKRKLRPRRRPARFMDGERP